MLSIQKHVPNPLHPIKFSARYSLKNLIQDMNQITILTKTLFIIAILAFTALICLSSAASKKSFEETFNNNPGRYTRGYGYHGDHGNRQERIRSNGPRQELSLPSFQVLIS